MGQMEPVAGLLGSSTPSAQMGYMGCVPNNPSLQQLSTVHNPSHQLEPGYSLGSHRFFSPINQQEVMGATSINPGSQPLSVSNKRKEPVSHHLSMPNKRVAQIRPTTRPSQMVPMTSAQGSQALAATTRKIGQMDSFPSKAGLQQATMPKGQSTQMEPPPQHRAASFEPVRSKLRESLAASLEMVYQQQDKPSNVGKDSLTEQNKTLTVAGDFKTETEVAPGREEEKPKPADVVPVPAGEDVSFSDSFFVKDDLLQGNGLSWATDIDTETARTKEMEDAKTYNLAKKEVFGQNVGKAVQSPQTLALQIEAELIKLFGGVNKKYKEKGRSLLFNLKDRSNPELSERVMSGEISPKRLCSMTAEELASKELSEWRIAKAEELAQMVVLPDTEVDVRRLVRKTHKGEFQVEVEQDDSVSADVSVGASSLTQIQPKGNKKEASPSKSDGAKDKMNVSSEKGNSEDLAILPHEGADPMQGLQVDEFKDTEFLPPIVSLDEFMESLDSEPPFQNLPRETGKVIPILAKGPESMSSDQAPNDAVDAKKKEPEEEEIAHAESHSNPKLDNSQLQTEASTLRHSPKVEHIWEGSLQLSVSDTATVKGFFKSGERASTKEWPSLLEIKGRVRLDAFKKFIQELPNSRSRAIMVVHFLLKDGSNQSEQATLSEVVESYISDDRLGFAEPAPGAEIYFCPVHTTTIEMLRNHLPKEYSESLNPTGNSLIGVVVWRKAHSSSRISPISSSHAPERKQYTSAKWREKGPNTSPGLISRPLPHTIPPRTNFDPTYGEDEDDVPPGFGPGRDEDDLPEFTFTGSSSTRQQSSQLSRQSLPQVGPGRAALGADSQAQQMRELIHKYGKSGTDAAPGNWQGNQGVGIWSKRWQDDDDDDDIPEWQPQAPRLPGPPMHNFLNRPPVPTMLPSMSMMQSSLGVSPAGMYVQGNSVNASGLGHDAKGGHVVGAAPLDWRRSRS